MSRSSQQRGKSFEAQVDELAALCGWEIHGVRAARTKRGWRTPIVGKPGFPDRVYVRGSVLLFRELKSGDAQPTADQLAWGELLLAAGQDWRIWRDDDFETIRRELNAPRS